LGLADDFLPNFFPLTPLGNGTVGRGYRDLLETGFKVGENSPSAKIPCRRICAHAKLCAPTVEYVYREVTGDIPLKGNKC
jgi:hypothetical protein